MEQNNERRRLISQESDELVSSRSESENNITWKNKFSQVTILVTVALERLAFYSISGNLVLFLNTSPFTWTSYNTMNASFFLFGIYCFFSLIGGWVADTVLGRFKTIVVGFFIYLIGYIFFPLLSKPNDGISNNSSMMLLPPMCGKNESDSSEGPFDENCAWLIYIVLAIMAVGTGTVNANIAPFGADQVRGENRQTVLGFFNWFYWSINIGSLVALSVITYVQQQWDFYYGYLAANICLAAAIVVFCMGCCTYTNSPATGSVLSNVCRVMKEALRKWRMRSEYYSRVPRTGSEVDTVDSMHVAANPTFLDYAKVRYGGRFHDSLVDDVKELWKIFCVFLSMIPYWIVYYQMETTFLVQGLHMKLFISDGQNRTQHCYNVNSNQTPNVTNDTNKPQIVAAWLSLFDIIFLIILIPFVDRILYPRLDSAGYPFTMVNRIGVGMLFATLAVFIAGVVEMLRLKSVYSDSTMPCCSYTIPQHIGGTIYHAAPMSIFWQVPQYALIGISEVFASIAGLEFAYQVAPKSMKGIIMGLFYLMSGVGSFAGTGLMYAFKSVFFSSDNGDINCRCIGGNGDMSGRSCHLDYYFFVLAGIELLGFFVFLLVAKRFHLNQYSSFTNVHVQQHNHTRPPDVAVKTGLRHYRSALRITSSDSADVNG